MICPACQGSMIVVEHQRIELDYCPKCHGVWFDHGELELMLNAVNPGYPPSPFHLIKDRQDTISTEKPRKCPICRQAMFKNTLGEKPLVLVDVCHRDDGIFFDGGEVTEFVQQLPLADRNLSKSAGPLLGFLGDAFRAQSKTNGL